LLLRRKAFHFADAVQAIQGGLLDGVLTDHLGGDTGVAKCQCQRVR
jgi:hypothetical protein